MLLTTQSRRIDEWLYSNAQRELCLTEYRMQSPRAPEGAVEAMTKVANMRTMPVKQQEFTNNEA